MNYEYQCQARYDKRTVTEMCTFAKYMEGHRPSSPTLYKMYICTIILSIVVTFYAFSFGISELFYIIIMCTPFYLITYYARHTYLTDNLFMVSKGAKLVSIGFLLLVSLETKYKDFFFKLADVNFEDKCTKIKFSSKEIICTPITSDGSLFTRIKVDRFKLYCITDYNIHLINADKGSEFILPILKSSIPTEELDSFLNFLKQCNYTEVSKSLKFIAPRK